MPLLPFFQGVVDAACPSNGLRKDVAALQAQLMAKTSECHSLARTVTQLEEALVRRTDEYDAVLQALTRAQCVIRGFRADTDTYLEAVEASRRVVKRLEADLQVQHALNLEAKISRMSLELQMIRHRNQTDEIIHGLESQLRLARNTVDMCAQREADAADELEAESGALQARVLRYLKDAPRSSVGSTQAADDDEDDFFDGDDDDSSSDEDDDTPIVRPRSGSACELDRRRPTTMGQLLASLRPSHRTSTGSIARLVKKPSLSKCNAHSRVFSKDRVTRWRLCQVMSPSVSSKAVFGSYTP
ncbi:hypothetical protein SDRG_15819 [Saprolegnia diclina VS20]|uniref:Uncharacterized protein n=1 Tax=Saprolegnia diclina (strain VS20) TaxID=1156394 RepID=T0PVN1_SAPDV|nr:hypothetical protein SDRG_15819 [Saprolegnia diclina VS20]EQC26331.1 hypothetical protein SDRG_15819 [Saprolegnia diclina VS20]|eukprot:XP_008620224.1 hypothetical protein SDRG_15819 [Saprolegnia diclina VS20]